MLDCQTPLGQFYMDEQYRVQEVLKARGYTIMNTSGMDHNSDVILGKEIDGRLVMTGVAEIKSRSSAGDKPLTREYLKDNGGYLITERKLKFGAMASSIYNVPFFVIVSLMAEGVILVWQITNNKGIFVETYVTKKTETRATVNGGVANRTNAFLPMDSKFLTTID